MAPTTRSKSKKKGNRDKKSRASKVVNQKHDKQETKCRFLELPPELRNRIYQYAKEASYSSSWDSLDYYPPLLSNSTKPTQPPSSSSARKFIGLTQVCKQIRAEFRPLWLRDSPIRIAIDDVQKFMATFYSTDADYKHAPRLFVIAWDHDDEEDVLMNLKPLIQLRAHCPTFNAKFVPQRVVEGDIPIRECEICGHSTYCGCDSDCDHEEAFEEALDDQLREYSYIHALDAFLNNNNENWLKAIRDDEADDMKVEFAVDIGQDLPGRRCLTIFIRFALHTEPSVFKTKNIHKTGLKYLKEMGMCDLKFWNLPDFVICVATGKHTRPFEGCRQPSPLYNQVLIRGLDCEELRSYDQPTSST